MNQLLVILALLVPGAAAANPLQTYDDRLCETAQTMISGAAEGQLQINVLYGEGDGFHTIQMDTDAVTGAVTIATSASTITVEGAPLRAAVACKMVNAARIRDVLGADLPHAPATCRDVNAATQASAAMMAKACDLYIE